MYLLSIKGLIDLVARIASRKFMWTYRLYPNWTNSHNISGSIRAPVIESMAIVIQGPTIDDDQFLLDTLKSYRAAFSDAIVILSTWHLSKKMQAILKKMDVRFITNIAPNNPGIANINLQIDTTKSGLALAKSLGARYAIKTRTDQRFNCANIDSYFFALINHYLPTAKFSHGQKRRLIATSLNTFKNRMYGVSDMLMFGYIDDMLDYWNVAHDLRLDSPEAQGKRANSSIEFSIQRICEVYLCTEYLKKIGRSVSFTFDNSFSALSDHFIIIDHESIRLYWNKYTLNIDHYGPPGTQPELSFADWFVLYTSPDDTVYDKQIPL